VLAGVLGLMLGIVLAFARNSFDRRLGTEGDLEGYVELPTLAMLRKAALGKTPLAPSEDRRTAAEDLESFRMLRTGLSIISAGEPAKCVLVTSPLAQEGKSSIAAGLAWAEAISGRRTLLVDCDLVHPTVAERTGLNASPGLTDYLLGNARPKDVMRLVKAGRKPDGGDASVVCIPAGTAVPNHAELLESSRFREFLQEVGSAYDCVILDSAPLLAVSDTLPLLPIVDAVIICLRLRQSTRDGAVAVSNALANFPEKPVGMVFTAADRAQGLYYSGSYAYAGARSGTAA
jgi:capsular exopolysaccharide synthesis family protein